MSFRIFLVMSYMPDPRENRGVSAGCGTYVCANLAYLNNLMLFTGAEIYLAKHGLSVA